MSFLVKVEGSESFEVAKECVRSVNVTTDIPLDRMQEPRTSAQLW